MNKRLVLFYGFCVYLLLMVFALLYFKERTMILDASYQLFCILRDNDLAIQINRFGAAMTQFFPLMASRLDWSIENVTRIYSAGFIIYYAVCFFIIVLGFRNYRIGICLLLYNVLMVCHSFYWIQCEIVQGVAFTLVYLAYIEQQLINGKFSKLFILLSPFFLVTIVFFYPLLLFVITFGLFFFAIQYPGWSHKPLLLLGLCYFVLFFVKVIFFKTEYDSTSMSYAKNIITLFPDYFNLVSNKEFLYSLVTLYYLFLIATIGCIIWYLYSRSYIKLFLLTVYLTGLTFLINVSYYQGAETFYLEPQYLTLSVFTAFALVYDVLPAIKTASLQISIIGAIILLSFFRIEGHHNVYSNRLDWFRTYLASTNDNVNKKIIFNQSQAPMDILKMTWASSYEFWLLSTVEDNNSRSVIISDNPGEFDWILPEKRKFLTKWGAFDYDALNPRYFMFSDTSAYVKR